MEVEEKGRKKRKEKLYNEKQTEECGKEKKIIKREGMNDI